MHDKKCSSLVSAVLLALLGLLISLWLPVAFPGTAVTQASRQSTRLVPHLPLPATQPPRPTAIITVCTAGPPTCDHSSLQGAVDAAGEGDTIKVAAGTYSGVQSRPVPPGYLNPPASGTITQVVYLSKTLTIQGGYTTSNGFAEPPDPLAYPTTLDAQGEGRAMVVAGPISPTIAGLRFTGGNASGLGGYSGVNWDPHDTGGGICVVEAAAVLSDNVILGNTAGSYGSGGGLYLLSSDASLLHNTFLTNTANTLYGGGIYTLYYDGAISDSDFTGNTAGWGGAVFLEFSPATLNGNDFSGNSCVMAGGALNVHTSDAEIVGNVISLNQATQAGGGMRFYDSAATFRGNVVSNNTTSGYGGGIHLWASPSTLVGNWIQDNTAGSTGGGLEFWLSDATLVNNFITDNQAGDSGTAMYVVWGSSPQLLHNTIARNLPSGASDGSGIFVDYYQILSTVALTNTILVSHSVGIFVTAGNMATLEATLWGNDIDWGGDGTVLTGTVNLWGDPGFVAPDLRDYHIEHASAAWDSGVATGVVTDIDGQPRPVGVACDIGADEIPIGFTITKLAFPDPVASGAPLTYTLQVSNNGLVTLTATISDVLPAQVTPSGVLTWTGQITPGGLWVESFTVTVDLGYVGLLTNVVQVNTEEGATGTYTHTATVEEPIAGLSATNDSPTVLGGVTTLTATITAGSNVSYSWDLGDGTWGTGSVLTYTYLAEGVYTALVTASNGVGLLTATTAVTITDAPIAGLNATNDSPTALGNPTTLSATITAGSNVSFTWDLGDGTLGAGSLLTHTYPAVGIYTALVTTSNSVSILTATTTVTVEEAIAGLSAFNDGPTVLGDPTALSATITTGTNVSYTWAFGDSTFGTGAVLTHTYPAALTYTAVVTASNSVSTMTATTVVTITGPAAYQIYLPLVVKNE